MSCGLRTGWAAVGGARAGSLEGGLWRYWSLAIVVTGRLALWEPSGLLRRRVGQRLGWRVVGAVPGWGSRPGRAGGAERVVRRESSTGAAVRLQAWYTARRQ